MAWNNYVEIYLFETIAPGKSKNPNRGQMSVDKEKVAAFIGVDGYLDTEVELKELSKKLAAFQKVLKNAIKEKKKVCVRTNY